MREEDAGVAEDASFEAGGIERDASIDPPASPSSSSSSSLPHLLTVKVADGRRLHEITLPMHATFGDLKASLSPLTGVYPHEQRLLFKGRQKEDSDVLLESGVKNNSKIMLLEDATSKERRMEEARQNERFAKSCEAVAHVREEVDKLAAQVTALKATVESGNKVPGNSFAMLSELPMRQLLKLDSIEAEGDAKVQRKDEGGHCFQKKCRYNFMSTAMSKILYYFCLILARTMWDSCKFCWFWKDFSSNEPI